MEHANSFVGRHIGNYQVVATISQRDCIQVYQGYHSIFADRVVALKFLDATLLSGQGYQRFAEVVRRFEHLKHSFILPLLDAGIYEEKPYLVTPYAPNGSLRMRLSRLKNRPLPHQEVLRILSQVGQALHAAHQQQLPHGNLKPENILFDEQNSACLVDFRHLVTLGQAPSSQREPFGTLVYMAPEQLQGVTELQSDQYALGCIAYELLTGSSPFIITNTC